MSQPKEQPTKRILNTGPRVTVLRGDAEPVRIAGKPGAGMVATEIAPDVWEAVRKMPIVGQLIESGTLAVGA